MEQGPGLHDNDFLLAGETGDDNEHEVWLQDKDNLEKWESGKISEMEKRILITHWAAAAWERVFTSQHPRKYFERTGCLLTIDGS